MDKKLLLSESLANFLKKHLHSINVTVDQFPQATSRSKLDGSPVTDLDLALSSLIEDIFFKNFPELTFYSEEKFSDWTFPLLALDPLDGTREYVEGRDEWAISLGLFENEAMSGEGWVYNPKTSELFEDADKKPFIQKPAYMGEVSRSEWKSGLFTGKATNKYQLQPMGSIAYKLGRLSAGKSDFVVSLRPKNIWDIAGGTLLCRKAGLKMYSQGIEVTGVRKLYEAPLLWCSEEMFPELSKLFP